MGAAWGATTLLCEILRKTVLELIAPMDRISTGAAPASPLCLLRMCLKTLGFCVNTSVSARARASTT
jgi:hypothetical protein